MDDVDRTFHSLRRSPYIVVFRELAKVGGISINQETCDPSLSDWRAEYNDKILDKHNWSREDFIEELKIKKYGKQ